ncbi:single-stranded DNA-binding protein [Brevibacterium oceani]|uniref:single-stranded DNA-binding protein n=1 Tax=Brevibacterium oceani TaxID=358099 RepID=UPI001C625287|nr:single-stranded DNA-binding protein [Brevibacterium oceani]
MSNVTVIGTINDPELRFTPAGKPVLGFSLAQNHRRKDQSGEWQDDGTTWRKVTVWDKKGEHLAEHLSKGMRVIVTGEERIREFEKKDGSGKGQSLELNAREVGIVPRRNSGGGSFPAPAGFNAEHQPTQPQSDPWAASNGQAEAPF